MGVHTDISTDPHTSDTHADVKIRYIMMDHADLE